MPAVSTSTSRSSTRLSHSSATAARSSTSAAPPIATSSPTLSGGISIVYTTATVTVSTPYETPSPAQSSRKSVTLPAGVIAGAVAGSVVVAIVLVLGWTCWAKKMQDRKRRHNCSKQKNTYWRRSHAHPYDKTAPGSSVNSEGAINIIDTVDANEKASSSNSHDTAVGFTKHKKHAHRTLQKNRKAHKREESMLAPILDVESESNEPTSPTPSGFSEAPPRYSSPMVQFPSGVVRKASTVGSASIYSTQSGEERHMSVNADLLKAAFGIPALNEAASISHKPSNVSSVYSSQSGEDRQYSIMSQAIHPSQKRLTGWTPSLGSMYSTAEEQHQPSISTRPRIGAKGAAGTPSRLSRFSFYAPSEGGLADGGEEAAA